MIVLSQVPVNYVAACIIVKRVEADGYVSMSECEQTLTRPPVPRHGKTSSLISWKRPLEIKDHGLIPVSGVYKQCT